MRKSWFKWLRRSLFSLCGALILIIALSFFRSFGVDYAPINYRTWECGIDRGTIVITALGQYEREGWTAWRNAPGLLRQQVKANQDPEDAAATRVRITPGILYVADGQYLQFSFPAWLLLPPVFALSYIAKALIKRTQLLRRAGKFALAVLYYGVPLALALLSAATIFSFYRCLSLDHWTLEASNIVTFDKGAMTFWHETAGDRFDQGNAIETQAPGSSLDQFKDLEDPINRLPGDYYFRCTTYCCVYRGISGFYITLPLWLGLALADAGFFFIAYRPLRRIRRRRLIAAGHCPQCNYDLRAHHAGGAGDKCPECGTSIQDQPSATIEATKGDRHDHR